MLNAKNIGCMFGCALLGVVGAKILGSKDAKKVYTRVTALALRAKEDVMTTYTNIKENAGDILADAKQINENRAATEEAEIIHNTAEV